MIAPALLVLALAAEPAAAAATGGSPPEEPASAAGREPAGPPAREASPPSPPVPEERWLGTHLALGAGPFTSRLYGLHVSGYSFQGWASHDLVRGSEPEAAFDLGLAVDVGSTEERLRVVHVEALGVVARRFGPLRLGGGAGLGLIDVERVTSGGPLLMLVPSLHLVAALDLPIPGPIRLSLEIQGALAWPWDEQQWDEAYPAFPRLTGIVRVRF